MGRFPRIYLLWTWQWCLAAASDPAWLFLFQGNDRSYLLLWRGFLAVGWTRLELKWASWSESLSLWKKMATFREDWHQPGNMTQRSYNCCEFCCSKGGSSVSRIDLVSGHCGHRSTFTWLCRTMNHSSRCSNFVSLQLLTVKLRMDHGCFHRLVENHYFQ